MHAFSVDGKHFGRFQIDPVWCGWGQNRHEDLYADCFLVALANVFVLMPRCWCQFSHSFWFTSRTSMSLGTRGPGVHPLASRTRGSMMPTSVKPLYAGPCSNNYESHHPVSNRSDYYLLSS